jgi:dTDP-4-amino-4,6-dideoxygalactose transaminase
MTDLQAGLGIEQLKKINFFWKKRKEIFNIYKRNLLNLPIKFQEFNQKKIKHAYHLFLFYIDKNKTKKTREKLVEFLKINKIGFGIHYPSITDMTYYKKEFKWTKKTTPISLEIGRNTISLPLYPHLKKKEVHYICSKIKKFFFNDK